MNNSLPQPTRSGPLERIVRRHHWHSSWKPTLPERETALTISASRISCSSTLPCCSRGGHVHRRNFRVDPPQTVMPAVPASTTRFSHSTSRARRFDEVRNCLSRSALCTASSPSLSSFPASCSDSARATWPLVHAIKITPEDGLRFGAGYASPFRRTSTRGESSFALPRVLAAQNIRTPAARAILRLSIHNGA